MKNAQKIKMCCKHSIKRYINELNGATAIEYGLIGASIAVAVGAVAFLIGDELEITMNTILTYLQQ